MDFVPGCGRHLGNFLAFSHGHIDTGKEVNKTSCSHCWQDVALQLSQFVEFFYEARVRYL